MNEPVIRTSQLGKCFTISHESRLPYRRLGDIFSRNGKNKSKAKEVFWALRDINFELQRGEALGIIGRNGAGKTTLLKLLSRITEPTTGRIEINGRVASLLEVGTGFHPELTGRENIFLNGSILGMTRSEIRKKFDEIVEFSEISRFLDTQVKKYSSGMYVRLAFAVAAHLEPDVLIVDEVLAVGDAAFQKKCMGKMEAVTAGEGRTILFVSHNMTAIKNLCNKCLYIKEGRAAGLGNVSEIIHQYYAEDGESRNASRENPGRSSNIFTSWDIEDHPDFIVEPRENARFRFYFKSSSPLHGVELGFVIRNEEGDLVMTASSRDGNKNLVNIETGSHIFSFEARLPVRFGTYSVDIILRSQDRVIDHWLPGKNFKVKNDMSSVLEEKWLGIVNETVDFKYEKEGILSHERKLS